MAAPRYRPSRDANHGEIEGRFLRWGASVFDAARVGDGFPDLVVGLCGVTLLVEVKDGKKRPSARRLRPNQDEFHSDWRGGPVLVIEGVEEVDRLCMNLRREAAGR